VVYQSASYICVRSGLERASGVCPAPECIDQLFELPKYAAQRISVSIVPRLQYPQTPELVFFVPVRRVVVVGRRLNRSAALLSTGDSHIRLAVRVGSAQGPKARRVSNALKRLSSLRSRHDHSWRGGTRRRTPAIGPNCMYAKDCNTYL
jgi:hypothetical protein